MAASVKDIIRRRKSVRTYSGEALRSEDRQKLDEFLKTSDNPFGVPVEFRFLDAKEYALSSPVIVGTVPLRSAVFRSQRSPMDIALRHSACLRSRLVSVQSCWQRRSAAAPLSEQWRSRIQQSCLLQAPSDTLRISSLFGKR